MDDREKQETNVERAPGVARRPALRSVEQEEMMRHALDAGRRNDVVKGKAMLFGIAAFFLLALLGSLIYLANRTVAPQQPSGY